MKERERVIATGLVVLMLVAWLGFLLHQSPRFAGGFWGGVLAVSGALLMLVPLPYMVVKRVKPIKARVTKYVSMRTLLAWHIYAGILGPILVLLHTGHKFESPLGIALVALTLLVVLSGFVGRYLVVQLSKDIREKQGMLDELQTAYATAAEQLGQRPELAALVRPLSRLFLWPLAIERADAAAASPTQVLQLVDSIAEVEYAIKTHGLFKRWLSRWLKFHIVISFVLYALLLLHVWAAVHFGLRWFESWA